MIQITLEINDEIYSAKCDDVEKSEIIHRLMFRIRRKNETC